MHYNFTQKIIRYSQSTINALTGPIIHVRGRSTHLWYSENTQ